MRVMILYLSLKKKRTLNIAFIRSELHESEEKVFVYVCVCVKHNQSILLHHGTLFLQKQKSKIIYFMTIYICR